MGYIRNTYKKHVDYIFSICNFYVITYGIHIDYISLFLGWFVFLFFWNQTRWKSEETPSKTEPGLEKNKVKRSPILARLVHGWCTGQCTAQSTAVNHPCSGAPLVTVCGHHPCSGPQWMHGSITLRDSKQIQIGQPAKRQVSSWRAGVGRGSTGTPGGGRSRGDPTGTGAGGGRAGVGRGT